MRIARNVAIGVILGLLAFLALRTDPGHETSDRNPESVKTLRGLDPASPAVAKTEEENFHPVVGTPPPAADLAGQPAHMPPRREDLATAERPPLADRLGAKDTPSAEEPLIVLKVLEAYRRSLGVYPAGEGNREIVNALLGANEQKMPFLPLDHVRLNSVGELVDFWGRPFSFHQISRDHIEVRSAGADAVFYTADDLLAGDKSKMNDLEDLHLH